jgi:hypothetical protein
VTQSPEACPANAYREAPKGQNDGSLGTKIGPILEYLFSQK